ncbi:hypothetical protein F383_24125 [Gossypium arboreum]|uniref:Uncharacterized protein n=1 Tax=Gossypium arboreum TaxID=29729 RepID=A0A0B0P797_GOSAR|nr:hypothetical protein F383_24125 [Gossypium arboreum]KHG19231.1 hypothetical protein F383_24125 [Gossypium arboreum]
MLQIEVFKYYKLKCLFAGH